MAENKKPNLVYVAVLAVAGGGLLFDKFVLSADAGVGDAVVVDAAAEQQNQQAVAAPEVVREPLAGRFNEAQMILPQRALRRLDAFGKPREDRAEVLQQDQPSASSGFAARHKLTSVLSQEGGDIAVVDGQLYKVGESIDGVELIKVEQDGAVFKSGDTEIRLYLPRRGLDR